jgi:PKD repeat protein
MGAWKKATLLAGLMMISGLAGCFGNDDDESNGEIVAVFSYSPATNIRAGQTIDFDAGDSLPSGIALTYKWDFDSDNSIDATGRTSDYKYPEAGTYTVTLTVSDGSKSQSTSKELTIVDATALPPTAEITPESSEEDCLGEDVSTGNYIHIWICDLDKSQSDRTADGETTVQLDASESSSGSNDDYISKYYWDLDLTYDADGDGDSENDNDLEGETVEWKDLGHGDYEVGLTITNGKGLSDSDTMKIHISYGASWLDFPIGGRRAQAPTQIAYDFLANYNTDTDNTVKKVVGDLMYPQNDEPCFAGDCTGKLDLFAYNEEGDEASNTTESEDSGYESRDGGDCDSDKYCVTMTLSSYIFNDEDLDCCYGEGEWEIKISNNEAAEQQVDSFFLRLVYK